MEPLITVVVPTYRRPQQVGRAVQSVLAQTLQNIEVIVVLDGPHAETTQVLEQIHDERLRVMVLPTNQGVFVARSTGISAAKAKWIAHLDDDDEWLPQKLEKQFAAVTNSKHRLAIGTCQVIAKTQGGEAIWPRRMPTPGEPISEYLFVRNSFFQGEGVIQASTMLIPKELLERVPIGKMEQHETKCHDDWDWILKATVLKDVGIEFVAEPLSVWDLTHEQGSLSRSTPWSSSYRWIRGKRSIITPRAYSSFLLSEVSARAAKNRAWHAFFILLWEALRFGKPKPRDLVLYLGMWLTPPNVRQWLRQSWVENRSQIGQSTATV